MSTEFMPKGLVAPDHPRLRTGSVEFTHVNDKARRKASGLLEMAKSLDNAVGLAAPQVGWDDNLFVAKVGKGWRVFFNAHIYGHSPSSFEMLCPAKDEVCLSLPGVVRKVRRPQVIRVSYQNFNGEHRNRKYTFDFARVICHEIDHLKGVLITDHCHECGCRVSWETRYCWDCKVRVPDARYIK